MHELSLCRCIQGIVRAHAAGRAVVRVELRVGHLRQVVPDTLARCWELLTEGTELAGTVLDVDEVPAVVECRSCGERTVLDAPVLRCGTCGDRDVVLVAGEELLVAALELEGS